MRFFSKAAVWIGTAGLICVASFFVDGAEPASPPYGLEERVPWTTSNVRSRPEPPPPYRPERVYSKLRFKGTTLMDVVPGSGQLLVGEQGGKIFLLPKDRDAEQAEVFLDCKQVVEHLNRDAKQKLAFDALYGMAFDPDFAKNRYCYVCYVVHDTDSAGQSPNGSRVSRFRVSDTDPLTCDVASEELIIS